jgi:phosphoglycolate phosphatase
MQSATDPAGISLVCCGLIGSLVADDGLIERSFAEAIATQGVVSGTSAFARRMSQVHQARGRAALDVLRVLFPDNEPRVQAAELAFSRALPQALGRSEIKPIPGAVDALGEIRASGRRICVLTTFPRRVLDLVLEAADLIAHVDLAISIQDAPRGFPAPDLVLTAILRTGAASVQNVAVVHGTGAGMESGRRSGVAAAIGLLTGPHSAARLRGAGATHVLSSMADVPRLLARIDPVTPPAVRPAENGTADQAAPAPAPRLAAKPVPAKSARLASASVDVPSQGAQRPRRQG